MVTTKRISDNANKTNEYTDVDSFSKLDSVLKEISEDVFTWFSQNEIYAYYGVIQDNENFNLLAPGMVENLDELNFYVDVDDEFDEAISGTSAPTICSTFFVSDNITNQIDVNIFNVNIGRDLFQELFWYGYTDILELTPYWTEIGVLHSFTASNMGIVFSLVRWYPYTERQNLLNYVYNDFVSICHKNLNLLEESSVPGTIDFSTMKMFPMKNLFSCTHKYLNAFGNELSQVLPIDHQNCSEKQIEFSSLVVESGKFPEFRNYYMWFIKDYLKNDDLEKESLKPENCISSMDFDYMSELSDEVSVDDDFLYRKEFQKFIEDCGVKPQGMFKFF
jgi:hypothetical protein